MSPGPQASPSSSLRARGWVDVDRLLAYPQPLWAGTITAWVAAIAADLVMLFGATVEHRRACPQGRSPKAGYALLSVMLLLPLTAYGIWRGFVHVRRTHHRIAVPMTVVLGVAFVATMVGEYFVLKGVPAHLRPYCIPD